MIRVVIDTSILIAYLLTRGEKTSALMRRVRDRELVPIYSEAMLEELIVTAQRSKFRRRISAEALEALLDFLEATGEMVRVRAGMPALCTDPKDDMFLHAALAGKADFVISGDRHLLEVGEVSGVRVVGLTQQL